jgi:CRISPR/Cas system-associated protein Cas5 (RAMP superfamily)
MSWDVVLFNSREKIVSVEDINPNQLIDTDFDVEFERYFPDIKKDENYREVIGDGFTISYFIDSEPVSNKTVSLYGEKSIFALCIFARDNKWQLYNNASERMFDIENISDNAYKDFLKFKSSILDYKPKQKNLLTRLFGKK